MALVDVCFAQDQGLSSAPPFGALVVSPSFDSALRRFRTLSDQCIPYIYGAYNESTSRKPQSLGVAVQDDGSSNWVSSLGPFATAALWVFPTRLLKVALPAWQVAQETLLQERIEQHLRIGSGFRIRLFFSHRYASSNEQGFPHRQGDETMV